MKRPSHRHQVLPIQGFSQNLKVPIVNLPKDFLVSPRSKFFPVELLKDDGGGGLVICHKERVSGSSTTPVSLNLLLRLGRRF